MMPALDDLRIERLKPLLPPAILEEEFPLSDRGSATVGGAREQVRRCLHGEDDRLVVVVGPCSIDNVAAAQEYAGRLEALASRLAGELILLMRCYFEKPRTTVGWKGLINDPRLDGSFRINEGLRLARRLLTGIVGQGLGVACEFLDTITPQFLADCVAWGAIGARTTESQVHRELASGLSMPVGFKNPTSGAVKVAIDAVEAACCPHHFLGVTKQGLSAIVTTRGNPDCHVILRGSDSGPNHDQAAVSQVAGLLRARGRNHRVLVDCSHGNSGKDASRQPAVAATIAAQVAAGSRDLFGVMIESNLLSGRQDLVPGQTPLYGRSITDACLGWTETVPVLEQLAAAVISRRRS